MPSSVSSKSSSDSNPPPTPPTQPTTEPATPAIAIPNAANSSRKRSHGEAEDEDYDLSHAPTQTPGISPDPVHGAGLPRRDPMNGRNPTATEGQTNLSASSLEHGLNDRLGPTMLRQAMETDDEGQDTTSAKSSDEEGASPRRKALRRDDPNAVNASPATESSTDGLMRQLGLGWRSVGGDNTLQAGTRGWARYIETHYHLTNIEILAQSNSHGNAYLVGTHEGYYLFREDLSEARLVARHYHDLPTRLQGPQPQFEGPEPILAASSPINNPRRGNGQGNSTEEDTEMQG